MTFVRLPFSVRSLNVFVASLVFAWFPLLLACPFTEFDTCNLPCVYALFRLICNARYVSKKLVSREKNMEFTVNMLLTCIIYCDTGPGCLIIKTACKYSM